MNDRTQIGEYLRYDKLPLFWCPGCSDGIVLGAIVRSFAELGLKKEEIVVVTGIGCWGKADDYLGTHTLHVTHGRALAFATGVKAAKPELTVVALMGDGDCATIGGNHFIHAARRNIGVTAIVVNNLNYGMTGGQYSATTPEGSSTSTSPLGSLEPAFDLCELGESGRRSFRRPFNALPHSAVAGFHQRGYRQERLRPGGRHEYLPDPLRPAQPTCNTRTDDGMAAGSCCDGESVCGAADGRAGKGFHHWQVCRPRTR